MELIKLEDDADNKQRQNESSTEKVQFPLQQRQSLDVQQQSQEEQNSVHFFQTTRIQVSGKNPPDFLDMEMQLQNNQCQHSEVQMLNTLQTKANPGRESRSQGKVYFGLLLQSILPQVDNERASELQTLLSKLKRNEITRENFLRLLRNIVGTHMLTEAVMKRKIQVSSVSSLGSEAKAKTAPKRHLGQEKPVEDFVTPPLLSSKRQKLSKTVPHQSNFKQLNDVTTVSGINLREEEELLISQLKEASQVSNSLQRVAHERETLILQSSSLQGKLAQIMSKCGIKSSSKDVERCLSLSVEERMHGLISNLIMISKKRVDFEKTRHQILVTSDVQHLIVVMNQRTPEWEKQQSEESGGEIVVGGDMDKDANCLGTPKANKVKRMVAEMLRTAAANVAAQAAVGGDDLTSKWQVMGKKVSQKHARRIAATSSAQPSEKVMYMLSQTSGRRIGNRQESQGKVIGTEKKFDGDQFVMPQEKVLHQISIKDVIAVLQREPQMSKSTFIHRLHERLKADAAAD